jgi:HD-GYP domain-containing protein (c-di-GMP phosphodiesterase class II)
VSEQQLQDLTLDFDEFLSRGVQPVDSHYPSRHALQTAMLAESIGTVMGLRKDELMELGFGCLLHDAGMLLVPANLHQVDRPLQVSERLELQKHPIYAADLLNRSRNVPHGAKMVVYQMHERLNGTGYPRQRQGSQIHTLARIAAVADTFLAMVSPRSFRQGLPPYKAVEKLLFATRQGYFDPAAVRGLLHAVSLFPLGSMVQLSDGRQGRVIRGNRDRFAQPVVEVVDLSGPLPRTELIDLSQRSDLQVVSTVGEPVSQAVATV